jgi:magnesium-transporting ATPase (P-type)
LYLQATTLTFAAIVFAQIGNGLSCRNELGSVMGIGLFSNRYYCGSVAIEIVILALLITVPILSDIFATEPFEPIYWGAVVAITPTVFFAEEARKFLFARFWLNKAK